MSVRVFRKWGRTSRHVMSIKIDRTGGSSPRNTSKVLLVPMQYYFQGRVFLYVLTHRRGAFSQFSQVLNDRVVYFIYIVSAYFVRMTPTPQSCHVTFFLKR